MLSIPKPTRTRIINFECMEDSFNLIKRLGTLYSLAAMSSVRSLLNSDELFLLEMLETLDIEAIESSKEICEKIDTLYRFIITFR